MPCSTQGEGPIDQRQHRARQAHGATHGRFEQFLATTLQMPHALLMKRPREAIVHAPAVMHERSRPLEPEQLFGRSMTAGRIDHVTRFLRADKSVQPSRTAPHAPTRFVGRDLRCGTQVFTKLFVGRSTTRGRTEGRTDAGTSGETQLGEQRAQQSDALAVRQAELLMEDRQHACTFGPS